jgi:hypothetical protein
MGSRRPYPWRDVDADPRNPQHCLRRMEVPDTVYGNELKAPQHVSDIIRLKVLWEEGGENAILDIMLH